MLHATTHARTTACVVVFNGPASATRSTRRCQRIKKSIKNPNPMEPRGCRMESDAREARIVWQAPLGPHIACWLDPATLYALPMRSTPHGTLQELHDAIHGRLFQDVNKSATILRARDDITSAAQFKKWVWNQPASAPAPARHQALT